VSLPIVLFETLILNYQKNTTFGTPITPTASDMGYIRTEFATTFKMSTYLVAWVVAPKDFGYKESTFAGKKVRNLLKQLKFFSN
jgi:hypothetical protein